MCNLNSQTFPHGSCRDWIHTLRNEVNLPPHTNTKINFKCVKGLTLCDSSENILFQVHVALNGSLNMAARTQATKGKSETSEMIKKKKKQLLFFKLNHQKSKARTCRMETIFVNHVPNRIIVSIIYKEHVQNPLRIWEAVSLDCVTGQWGPGKMTSLAITQTQLNHSHASRTGYKGYNFKKESKC